MPDTYCDSAAISVSADKLCRLPWIQSTLLANSLPLRYRRLLYFEGNLTTTARRDYDEMINEQRKKKNWMPCSEPIATPLFPH